MMLSIGFYRHVKNLILLTDSFSENYLNHQFSALNPRIKIFFPDRKLYYNDFPYCLLHPSKKIKNNYMFSNIVLNALNNS